MLSCVRLCATPWTVARQASLSMGFSRQEYWSGYFHSISSSRGRAQCWNVRKGRQEGGGGGREAGLTSLNKDGNLLKVLVPRPSRALTDEASVR